MKNACFYHYKPAELITYYNEINSEPKLNEKDKKVNTSFSNIGMLLEHLKQFTRRTPLLTFLATTVSAVNS